MTDRETPLQTVTLARQAAVRRATHPYAMAVGLAPNSGVHIFATHPERHFSLCVRLVRRARSIGCEPLVLDQVTCETCLRAFIREVDPQ